jgi:pimeloyl-ACP methyl ester carboxylesterase
MLIALLSLALLMPLPQEKFRQEIAVDEDGYSLPVKYYPPPFAGAPNIVIVHDWGGSSEDWTEIAEFLRTFGNGVVLFDLRGHGGSTTAYYYFTDAQVAGMVDDVILAVGFAREKGNGPVHILGADIGANLALVAAAQLGDVGKVIAVSPGLDYRGMEIAGALDKMPNDKVLLLASQEDVYSVYSIRELVRLYPVERRLYQNAGHGVWLLRRQREILQEIIDWLR